MRFHRRFRAIRTSPPSRPCDGPALNGNATFTRNACQPSFSARAETVMSPATSTSTESAIGRQHTVQSSIAS